MTAEPRGLATRLAGLGRTTVDGATTVNPPVQRASTVLLDEVALLYGGSHKSYGLQGLSVQDALSAALLEIEGGAACVLAPSGLAACTLALLAVLRSGDEVLVTDSVYRPTRRFCAGLLKRFGVHTRFFPPRAGAGVADLIGPRTKAVFLESPGSLTFEVQDVPAIAAAARVRGAVTIIDNTWSAGLFFSPFAYGVDLSVQALTKHQAGHADVLMGAVLCATPALGAQVRQAHLELGLGASPDDAYLVLRGLRSMPARVAAQARSALEIATWLETRGEVGAVLHPALPSHPDHNLWKRDFSGATSTFAFTLAHDPGPERLAAMLEGYNILSMGFSWGGFESLIVPCDPQVQRDCAPWRASGPLLRLSVGLEDAADLIADLEAGFARLSA